VPVYSSSFAGYSRCLPTEGWLRLSTRGWWFCVKVTKPTFVRDFAPTCITTKQKANICNSFQVIMHTHTHTHSSTKWIGYAYVMTTVRQSNQIWKITEVSDRQVYIPKGLENQLTLYHLKPMASKLAYIKLMFSTITDNVGLLSWICWRPGFKGLGKQQQQHCTFS